MSSVFKNVLSCLKARGLTLSVAESCTGGLIAKKITDLPGASQVFCGGVVSYTNEVKMRVLGVSKATLDKYTELSLKCAEEMAYGVRRAMNTDIGISTTGVAGPSGGEVNNPVGTVYVAISIKEQIYSYRLELSPSLSRKKIRDEASVTLLSLLLEKIEENY